MTVRKGDGWKGSLETGISFRPVKFSNQYLTFQWYHEHAESLINYERFTSKLRIGMIIKPSKSIFY